MENACRATNLTQGLPSRSNLQAAINAAHTGDRISIEGVCVGSFLIDEDLTLVGQRDPGGSMPVLNGEGAWERVLRVAARVTLTNLKVTGGLTRGVNQGGGILVWKGGILTLNRSVIRGNSSKYEGGGIANFGRLTLNRSSSVSRNEARTGGGIANYGTLELNGSSSVRANTALVLGGGGVVNYGTLVMNGSSSVRGNTAYEGGGIFLDTPRHTTDPTVTMNDSSSVSGNHAANDGGGIFFRAGTVTLNDWSSVSGNDATNAGGGIWSTGTVTLKASSSVQENTADLGGGISNHSWASLTMDDSSSVIGNTADAGGGIWNLGTLTMNDSASVSGNTADSGGGILNNIEATISQSGSSTVSGNQGGEIHQIEDPRGGMSGEGFAAIAKLILVAIAAGALIARPWVRATALAVTTGFMGILVAGDLFGHLATEPEDWGWTVAWGWFFGVVAGVLLGVAVFRLRSKAWPSGGAAAAFVFSALLLSVVLALPAIVLYSNLIGRLL